MKLKYYLKKFLALGLSILLLLISQWDMGSGGTFLIMTVITVFIFIELSYIRRSIINIYADAITEHKILLFFLRNKLINLLLSAIISIYLSFYLFIHVNLATLPELLFFFITGILLTILIRPTKDLVNEYTKEKPAKVFSRVGVVFIVVLIVVLLDGIYNSFFPIDSRIRMVIDVDIPLYVIEDIKHSFFYLQSLLRTAMYLKYNIQSIGLYENIGNWGIIIRFLLLLSPTPYIAYALLFLSFSAIKKLRFEVER